MKYAGVIVDISHEQVDKVFTYAVPEELQESLQIGNRVKIPFGRMTRTGYVVEEIITPDYDPDKIRPITEILPGSITADERMIRLAFWMKSNYGGTISQALKTVLPVKDKVKQQNKRSIRLNIDPMEALKTAEEARRKHRPAQARLLEALAGTGIADYSLLNQKLNISMTTVEALEKQGLITVESITAFRNAVAEHKLTTKRVELNSRQRQIADSIIAQMREGDLTPCLIKGVTGSGKTEVYMELIEETIKQGREAIVLIPEIALTYQTVMRFYNRFGDVVSIIHSRLSAGEKYDRFALAKEGRLKIMIGPRSALFTPFQNLGLIVIDEEHETAYQCENVPKYHARETAIALADLSGGKVVMGSATPSLESYYKAQKGEYHFFVLNKRAGTARMPEVHVVDLRTELRKGNRSVFSEQLQQLIADRLSRKEQIMLFLNRRGLKSLITCRDCGKTLDCPNCAVSMTIHYNNKMVCHYCGHEEPFVQKCPYCGSVRIGAYKAGTEAIEEEARKLFPKARILRMDKDTTSGKDGHAVILEKFANEEADILIGTQMIVKGHDFPNVTLMGILVADTSLHAPDYTAAERTFELLTQAAGRAGRADKPGEVVIQTYDPEHYAVQTAATQDYEAFYEQEIQYRQLMDYPPVSHMLTAQISSEDEKLLTDKAQEIKAVTTLPAIRAIGPTDAPLYKLNNVYYKMIYYKQADNGLLTEQKDRIEQYVREHESEFRPIQIQFDFR